MADSEKTTFQTFFEAPLRNGLTRPKAVRGTGTKMVNMGEIFSHGRIREIEMDRVPVSDEEAELFLLEPGDLLFARQSLVLEGAGKCAIFLGANGPVTFESHIIRARLDREVADPLFFYYFFNSPAGRSAIASIVEQVAAAGIRSRDLAKLEVPRFPLDRQRAIAHILVTLDDKIELNRRMNETLEAMARAIFKSWFVDFDPIRAKTEGRWRRGESLPGLPAHVYDLFPDRFEDSELGEMPAGWQVGTLDDVADHPRRGVRPHEIDASTPYIALEHMPKRCIALSEWGVADGLESNKFEFKRGEILFGKLRPYFHKVGVAPVDGVCSTDIVVVGPHLQSWFGFVLGHVSSAAFVEYTDAGSTGTKMPRTSWGEMARYPMVIPPESIADAYTARIRPAVDRIVGSIHESRTLAALRDTLLPKLISGELRVKDAENIRNGAA